MSAAVEKARWPRAEALAVAAELVRRLRGSCERIRVAGSIRRGKELVGDVELLFVPRMEERPEGLFDTALVDMAAEAIEGLLHRGILVKRLTVSGTVLWGAKNRLAVHAASGMPVDLFAATEETWANMLVCRTGPARSNVRIAARAQERGWQWNPYGVGFSRGSDLRAMRTEEEVFKFVGLPFRAAKERV